MLMFSLSYMVISATQENINYTNQRLIWISLRKDRSVSSAVGLLQFRALVKYVQFYRVRVTLVLYVYASLQYTLLL